MKSLKIILLMSLTAATVAMIPASSVAKRECAPREKALKFLSERHGEVPVGRGLLSNSSYVAELTVSETGSWTFLGTSPQGVTCILRSGQAWSEIKPTPPAPAGDGS